MAANGVLDFQSTNKLIFRGANANVVIDTQNLSLGVGHQGEGAITSNLFVTGNAHVSTDLSVGGGLTVDTTTFHVDTANDRVGVGTTSPDSKLHIYDTTTEPIIALQHLSGTENNSSTNILGNLALHYSSRSGGYPSVGIRSIRRADTWDDQADMEFYVRNGGNGEQTAMVINSASTTNGAQIGIGTRNPSRLFHVHQNLSTSGHQIMARIGGDTSSYTTLVFGSKEGRPHIGGHKGDFSAWHNLSLQDDKMVIEQGGSLILKQHSKPSGSSESQGMRFTHSAGTERWQLYLSNNNHFRFAYAGTAKGYVDQNDGNAQMNFTGQHRTFIKDTPFTQATELEGLIVSADQNKYIKMSGGIEVGSNAITVNESLPLVSLSVTTKDKKCFGVISASEDPETREDAFGNFVSITQKEVGDTRVYINSVGEGAIWVSNIGGSLESGDYITTSTVKGYGQKQDSEFLANYTVAKITMDCDFDPVTQPVQVIKKDEDGENVLDEHGQIQWEDHPTETEKAYKIRYLDADGVKTDEVSAVHKAAFVGCTYHCG